ncbi:MAG TPA: exodeoxyribonuclease V subunit alpha [Gammaproteobacteria bacterium]|jgi:exodeoxyribonuclease V alpha subunit|nr:exodeoxyribonuclease V subunit alpha [Acidiferrobacteraceae bacterium]MDP6551697.1 exodeoxyribonuclease V subunit alpha [Arenicellales bacterium]MDP6792153.1 exodeoxyribonuclease V subunit alpha [Arenicellales bacterium]MDP6919703.1 exodeoxyribonuclease V subunit alpha [Arenicellales bacterium]HCX87825.1 exodeoxyribonuclease V subunit alpha [Gammaproteobacteria bacterium]|tara:strand:+ start:13028 stop:14800 length:1773 start_codon:yes stop_codon:yes gene_type:complete
MSAVMNAVQKAWRAGNVSEIALHFAGLLHRLDPEADPSVVLAGALAGERALSGDVCVNLASVAGGPVFEGEDDAALVAPGLGTWQQALQDCALVSDGNRTAPLVLSDDGRLYLYRYHELERRLAELITRRSGHISDAVDQSQLNDALDALFSDDPASADQRKAAERAVGRRLLVISGGPGTGKTATVVRILALVHQLALVSPERALLCAPTGKAAARLREAVAGARGMLPDDMHRLPQAVTVHRLLGSRPGQPPRYQALRPLPCDLLILDEASMVDLSLMVSLFDALPPDARLILLGDRDQLSSVEAGAVLGDICRAADSGVLAGSLATLKHNWRFKAQSPLGALAGAVRDTQVSDAKALLENTDAAEALLIPVADAAALDALLTERIVPMFAELERLVLDGADIESVFAKRAAMMVLCAHRRGPRGVTDINARIRSRLGGGAAQSRGAQVYPGMPLMVMRNDPVLGLYNGDIGIVVADAEAPGRLQAVFQNTHGEVHAVSLSRLPEYQPAYAFTVHKAQGSQAPAVTLILPEKVSAILSRELVYTGVTRAGRSLEIWGSQEVLAAAIARSARRPTGLADRLQRGTDPCP